MRPQTGKLGQLPTAAVVLCVTLLLATNAAAQQPTAKIVGTVTDQQGAVVPGVKIIVTNKATNVVTETTTDAGGFYQVLNLPIGAYRIVARCEGFRPLEVTTAPLEINQSFRAGLQLIVGAPTEEVLVEAQTSGVETINPTIGQSVTSRPIVNMPLNGRNVLDLALLQPGVTAHNPDDTSAGHFNVAGGRSDSITYLLDGGLNNDLLGNGVVYNPNPDTVQEFRILTSNYTAEYGRTGAGVISVVTKSGTNDFHGSAFEYARNTDFDANSYFNKQIGTPRNDLKRHQFGGTFGGPITIPHLLEGKGAFLFRRLPRPASDTNRDQFGHNNVHARRTGNGKWHDGRGFLSRDTLRWSGMHSSDRMPGPKRRCLPRDEHLLSIECWPGGPSDH